MNVPAITDLSTQDLDALLEGSRGRRNPSLLMPLFMLGILVAAGISMASETPWLAPLVPLIFAALVGLSLWQAANAAKRQRDDNALLREADESIRLGHWDRANSSLSKLLSRPANRPHIRFQALIYAGGVLNRIGRYADVIRLYERLQEEAEFPAPVAVSVRCMQAYAMLRDDRLSDGYQALADLRRDARQATGMVALLEMYRLLKTGHNDDVLALFSEKRQQITAQMSHRSADGWALAAAAALALSREEQARTYARNAALLCDPAEILKRYPECARVVSGTATEGARP